MQTGLFTILISLAFAMNVCAQVSLGADVVSRYVWRGTDFGNAAAVQPALSFAKGGFEVGAWGSFAVDDGSANENDLYISYSSGPVTVMVTDYYFPGYTGNDFFGYYKVSLEAGEVGPHIIELGGSYETGPLSVSAFYNLLGDKTADDSGSFYLELGYTPSYSVEGVELSLFAGAGNGFYTLEAFDEDDVFGVVNLGISASKESISASYIINPNQETSFLVFGYSF
ncbi:MAG: hypothetical protein DWQ10_10255 [Calditrichaeota bacterium]|nr:MAG: hypothetical protein DWQ10_10255 [Calditrichota bacterium]